MKMRYKQQIKNPYSLHDMVLRRIIIKKECVYLEFCHGYVSTNPCLLYTSDAADD